MVLVMERDTKHRLRRFDNVFVLHSKFCLNFCPERRLRDKEVEAHKTVEQEFCGLPQYQVQWVATGRP